MIVCLFDIDGTLVSSGGAGKAAIEAALAEEFGVTVNVHVEFSGRTDRAIARDLLTLHGVEPTPEHLRRLVEGYLQRLPHYLSTMQGRVLPGIAELLEHLQKRNHCAVGLLTGNIRAGAKLKLGHFGLYHHFPFGGFGDEHHDRDNVAHEALAAARKHFNGQFSLANTWVIGDTPLDVQCARAIGAKVAAVATGWHTREQLAVTKPDLLLDDLADFEPLLRQWR